MGVLKYVGCAVAGIGAVVLAPMTGGGSIALAIGAMGTTTAAGALIGGAVGAAAAGIHDAATSDDSYQRGVAAGTQAGEYAAQKKYESKVAFLAERLEGYHDYENKLVALYALALAATKAGGANCADKREEFDQYIAGCGADKLPAHIVARIEKLATKPPTLLQALQIAKRANLPKESVDEIIDYFLVIDDEASMAEEKFLAQWAERSAKYEASVGEA